MYTNLPNIVFVATIEHVILRRYVVLTCMHDDKIFVVGCDIMVENRVNVITMRTIGCDNKEADIT